MSNKAPQYFIHSLRTEILRWLEGYLDYLSVEMEEGMKDYHNAIKVVIAYRPLGYAHSHTLTYPFYGYIGASFDNGVESFMGQVALDGVTFPKLM